MTDKRGLAVVTGTSSGIGESLARALVHRGWQVVGVARRSVDEYDGYEHLSLALADLNSVAVVEEYLAERVDELAGKPLGLVNNAAVAGQRRATSELDPDELSSTMTLNLTMPILLMGAFRRLCPEDAPLRIVNVSTGLASHAMPGVLDYCASKAGLLMASRVFAAEIEQRPGSGVLVYEPGVVDTEMQTTLRTTDPAQFPLVGMFQRFKSSGELTPPDKVIDPMIRFLESTSTGIKTDRFGGGPR